MHHKAILKALGGAHAVHAALTARGVTISPVAVRAWSLSGRTIPAKYWNHIREIGRASSVDISIDELADAVSASTAVASKEQAA